MHDLVIRGGFLVDGTGRPGRLADVVVNDGADHRRDRCRLGRGCRGGDPGRRRDRQARHARLGRHPHALRRAGVVGSVPHAVVVARGDHRGDGQLRRRVRTRGPRPSRVVDRADGGRRGHPGHGADRGHAWDWETFEEYLDALDASPVRHRHRRAGRARPGARVRDGRPRCRQRTGDRRRHRRDGRHRRAGPAGGSARVLHVAHADPPVEVRRVGAGHARHERRTVRDRRRTGPGRPRRLPVRARSCARAA
jgi:hypothetical protein